MVTAGLGLARASCGRRAIPAGPWLIPTSAGTEEAGRRRGSAVQEAAEGMIPGGSGASHLAGHSQALGSLGVFLPLKIF